MRAIGGLWKAAMAVVIAGGGLMLLIVGFGLVLRETVADPSSPNAAAVLKVTADSDPRGIAAGRKVNLTNFDWRKGGFGTVMIATFTISNENDFAIKDLYVACELTAPSGTKIGYAAATLYERVPAHGRKTVREVNMGSGISRDFNQAATASCKLGPFDKAS